MTSLPLEPGIFRTSRCSGKRGPKSESKGEAVDQTDNGRYFVQVQTQNPGLKTRTGNRNYRHRLHLQLKAVRLITKSKLIRWPISTLVNNNATCYEVEVGKVYIRAKWPTRPELIPVSLTWSDWEYLYSPMDGMLVHRRVTRSIKFAGTHLYTWVERGTVRVKCLAQEHNTMSPARARTRTTRSRDGRTIHEVTAPPTIQNLHVNWNSFSKIMLYCLFFL